MKAIILLTEIALLTGVAAYSQNTEQSEKKTSIEFDWAGHLAIAKDVKTNVFLTVGGPSIKIGINKIAINIGFCPSLKFNYEYDVKTDKTPLSPILGAAAMISYKHLIGGCIFYSIKNIWYAAPTVGYKFK